MEIYEIATYVSYLILYVGELCIVLTINQPPDKL